MIIHTCFFYGNANVRKIPFQPSKKQLLPKRKMKWVTVWIRANYFILLRFTVDFKQFRAKAG
jgi:hypothetical protein